MTPFIFGAAGLDGAWLVEIQTGARLVFSYWPIWMLISVIVAAVGHLFRSIPKIDRQLHGSSGASPKES
jgi:hypothetical protein